MLKSLKIDPYINGYNLEQISCKDIPVAGTAGYYDYDNYFIYCFYTSLHDNWMNYENIKPFDKYNIILSKFGLEIKMHTINDSGELIEFIKEFIDKSIPLLLSADYTSLPHTYFYLDDIPGSHLAIVCGYQAEKSIIMLRDTLVVDRFREKELSKCFNANPLFTMLLTETQLHEIWKSRNEFYKKNDIQIMNKLYSIEKVGQVKISNYQDMLFDCITNFNFKNDNLIEMLSNFNNLRNDIKNDKISMFFCQRKLHKSLEAFFGAIMIGLKQAYSENSFDDIYKYKEEYMTMRSKILALMYANALREKDIDKSVKDKYISAMEMMNEKLLNIVTYSYEMIKKENNLHINKKKLVNYALGAKASADSEFVLESLGAKSCASNTVSGKWAHSYFDAWRSNSECKEHWLKIDLIYPHSLTKIVVRHIAENEHEITKDFGVLGSIDDDTWDVLGSICENKKDVTIFQINRDEYRYLKLYITKPGEFNYDAKIYEFEAWGEEE